MSQEVRQVVLKQLPARGLLPMGHKNLCFTVSGQHALDIILSTTASMSSVVYNIRTVPCHCCTFQLHMGSCSLGAVVMHKSCEHCCAKSVIIHEPA